MSLPAIIFPHANNKSETWVATVAPDRVKIWRQDDHLTHLELSKDDLLQILSVLNGAARQVERVTQ